MMNRLIRGVSKLKLVKLGMSVGFWPVRPSADICGFRPGVSRRHNQDN